MAHNWIIDDEERTNNDIIKYISDIDILAIRLPNIYKNIGGHKDDWDKFLIKKFDIFNKMVGIICEVKTGYNSSK